MNISILNCIFAWFLFLFSISDNILAEKSHGFSDQIAWIDFDTAIQDKSRPTLLILHKSWCPACKNLKPKLAASPEFEQLSQKFSMVNAAEDDKLHENPHFNIDGGYIPRIFFLDPTGEVLSHMQNSKGNPNYKYFHYNAESVIESMKLVIEQFPVKDEL